MLVGHCKASLQNFVQLSVENIEEELTVLEVLLGTAGPIQNTAAPIGGLVKVLQDSHANKCEMICGGVRGQRIIEKMYEASHGVLEEMAANGAKF